MLEHNMLEKMINAFLSDYVAVIFVDLETGEYHTYSDLSHLEDSRPDGNFFEQFPKDAFLYVVEEDRDRFVEGLTKEALIRKIDSREKDLVEYRLLTSGGSVWHEIRLINGEYSQAMQYAILGIRDIDSEKRRSDELAKTAREKEKLNQIASALADIYDSLYYINLEDNSFIEFSSSDQYKKIRTMDSGENFFVVAKPLLSRFIHPEDTGSIVCLYDKAEMLRALRDNGGAYLTEYRFVIGDAVIFCRAGIRETRDGSHVLVSIRNLGQEKNIERKLQETVQLSMTYSQIAERLAEHYDRIYYVDVDTSGYMTFSSTELLSELETAERENHFFDTVGKNIDSIVYPEDRAKMRLFFERARLLENLKRLHTCQIEYRLLVNGAPNYVKLTAMLTKDGRHILLCVENINEQVLSYQDLTRKATYDELTGVRNKNAYQEFEQGIDRQIGSSEEPEFAVVVCDINNLKEINDTFGHTYGDRYIESACHLICDTFVHSPVFRVGGDEFIVFLKGTDYQNRTQLLASLQQTVERHARQEIHPARPVVAAGMAEYRPEKHRAVVDVFNEADQKMYERKRMLKEARA